MQIKTASNGSKKLCMTRREYEEIGRSSGWLDGNGELVKMHRCRKCGHRWNDSAVRWPRVDTFCPKCGHLYADWENYQQMKNEGAFIREEELE